MRAGLQGLFVGAACFVALGACADGGDPAPTDTQQEVEDLTGRSLYRMTITEGDEVVALDRELTGSSQAFAFGSTHIGPAVSFAMTDAVTFPRTVTVTLNFGIVVGSEAYPVQTDGPGEYAFDDTPPAVNVFYRGLQYRSTVAGSEGEISLTAWSVTTGEAMAGTFSGTLVAEGPSGATIDVSGDFHLTLPPRQ